MKPVHCACMLFMLVSAVFASEEAVPDTAETASPRELSGKLENGTVWTKQEGPYVIGGNVVVPEACTLTVEPGTHIRFDGYFQLIVKGTLIARGNADNETERIYFTSNLENPRKGDWYGIAFQGEQSGGVLEGCDIRYAYKNLCYKSSPLITRNIFLSNTHAVYCSYVKSARVVSNTFHRNIYGIYCDFSSPVIENNVISENEYGIYSIFSSTPVLKNNTFKDNREKDMHVDQSMQKTSNEDDKALKIIKGLF